MTRNDPDLPAFGTLIREQRTRLKLTQTQLAERLGWTQERISVLENGKYGVPSLPALVRVSEALEVPVMDLIQVLSGPLVAPNLDGSSPRPGVNSVALQYTLQR